MPEETPPRAQRYAYKALLSYSQGILERLGLGSKDAMEVAACLINADLRGVYSHGVVRLPVYAKRITAGIVNTQPQIRVEERTPNCALVDGDNGPGPVVAALAMTKAIELAQTHGAAFVAVRRSNHFGAAAHYVQKALTCGLIGIASSNAPPNMAPYGGKQKFLGTNPLAIGIPAGEEDALLFDAATSVVAKGKINVAAYKGVSIPEGWAINVEGYSTTDPHAALGGAVLPFGGHKGSGLSLIIDIFCGVLTGASFATHLNTLEDLTTEQNLGHVFTAMRTDLFMPAELFALRMDEILRLLKASPAAPGIERVLAAGEPEARVAAENRNHGIPIPAEIAAHLTSLGEEVGLAFPKPAEQSTNPNQE